MLLRGAPKRYKPGRTGWHTYWDSLACIHYRFHLLSRTFGL
ncbi:unnamed protein product [Gulo gulo]|uniref:Uncharacterized protein n=1 Tax=Gulo gulo TaxID=48420 RepID=A0A9X9LZY9_GULGU|nr:unnamed protein product [Gulo gulo]